ncbi:MAG: dockerin type I repeat-containing protein [Pirellulales bacterium]|nr:dockerin type I repeat-containing protein [Pirellulales bacterium]
MHRSCALAFVYALLCLTLLAGICQAAPTAKLEFMGDALSGNRKWSLFIDPDETLYTGGSPLAVEIAVLVQFPPVSATTVNSTIWDTPNPGNNPFAGTITNGLWSSTDEGVTTLFASFGSIILHEGGPVELLSFETAAGLWTTKLSWGQAASGSPVYGAVISQLVGQNAVSFAGQTGVVGLPGDANFDGFVNGSDYTIWADNFQLTGRSWTDADFNGDGVTDGADYTLWADNFQPVATAAIAVPEPAAQSLVAAGCLVACVHAVSARRRRKARSASRSAV